MLRIRNFKLSVVALLLAAAIDCSSGIARAELWPAGGPSLGGAIAARAISEACPGLMSDAEVGDLDTYIRKRSAEIAAISAEDAASVKVFAPALATEYARTEKCTDDSEEMAKDMLERVQDLLHESEQ